MKPFVSVLIPAYNEEDDISKCLESILRQDYPIDRYEVIVMDNGSTDRTKEVASGFNINIVDASGLNIGGVRNLGAELAKGNIFAYIDADCVAPQSWLQCGVSLLLSSRDVGAVGGGCDIRENASWVEKAWILNRPLPGISYRNILATGSFFIGKDEFVKVCGFNDTIKAGEDTEISRRLIENGKKLLFSTDIRVVHFGFPRTILDFISRQIWQSSDYLKSKKSYVDPIFILTHFSFITFSFFIINIFIYIYDKNVSNYFIFIPLLLNLLCSIALATYRYKKSKRPLELLLFAQVVILNHIYLFSRIVGLIISYSKSLRGRRPHAIT
jgi:glycosyltransferase involved in cell wall biosynthesis